MKYKRIHSIEQYNDYCNIYEKLIMKDSYRYAEEIDLLELLVEDYDNRTIESIGIKEDMNTVEVQQYLMEENSLSKS